MNKIHKSFMLVLAFAFLIQSLSIQAAEDERPGILKKIVIGYLFLSSSFIPKVAEAKHPWDGPLEGGSNNYSSRFNNGTQVFYPDLEKSFESTWKIPKSKGFIYVPSEEKQPLSSPHSENGLWGTVKSWGKRIVSCFPVLPDLLPLVSAEDVENPAKSFTEDEDDFLEDEDDSSETDEKPLDISVFDTIRESLTGNYHPVTVGFVGGGYTGVISSILLAKLRNYCRQPAFDVHLFEKDWFLMGGASIVTSRVHSGGEYPKDVVTAMQCLYSSVLFRQMFQTESVFTSRRHMDFLLAKESIENADKDEKLTLEELRKHYSHLNDTYQLIFDELSSQLGKNETSHLLFGYPRDFFEFLESSSAIEDERLRSHFAGGVRSNERGLQPIALGVLLERLLEKYNVHVHLGRTVTRAEHLSSGGYKLFSSLQDNTDEREFDVDYVVNAAWYEIPYLNNQVSKSFNPPVPISNRPTKVYLRSIGLFDVSKCKEIPSNHSYFGLMGGAGGMVSFFSPTVAIIYLPEEGLSYQGKYDLHDEVERESILDTKAQSHLNALTKPAKQSKLLSGILKRAKEKFPFLQDAKPITLVSRTTVSWDEEITQRQHIKPNWPFGKNTRWLQAYAAKATFSPLVALEVVSQIVQQANIRLPLGTERFLINLLNVTFAATDFPDSSLFKLPDEFVLFNESLARNPDFLAEMKLYALKRRLPLTMIEEVTNNNSTIIPHEQLTLMDWEHLDHVDIRSIKSNPEVFRALTTSIGSLPDHKGFKSLRFQYYPSEDESMTPAHEQAGLDFLQLLSNRPIDELEIDQLYLNSEKQVKALISLILTCDMESLALTRFASQITDNLLFPFLISLDTARSLKNVSLSFKTTPTRTVTKTFLMALQNVPDLEALTMVNSQLGAALDEPNNPESLKPLVQFIDRAKNLEHYNLYGNGLFAGRRHSQKHLVLDAVHENWRLKVDLRRNGLSSKEEEIKYAFEKMSIKCMDKFNRYTNFYTSGDMMFSLYSIGVGYSLYGSDSFVISWNSFGGEFDNESSIYTGAPSFDMKYTQPEPLEKIFAKNLTHAAGWVNEVWAASGKQIPSILISHEPTMKDRKQARRLYRNLITAGFPKDRVFYRKEKATAEELANRLKLINEVDRVIVVGSSELQEKYDERKISSDAIGVISSEIDAIRIRELEKGEAGIIPVYFSSWWNEDNFPASLQHLEARSMNNYEEDFFSLLQDIYQIPRKSKDNLFESIRENLKTSRENLEESRSYDFEDD
ncbi:MAG: FAD-dependent oxidoreductase [Alphaproteobacteria bacterium]|nr:FAD-dependent oxidoreductase [Alphaproteobacteria bacterium]